MTKQIMIVGVGGQGTLLASRILGNAVTDAGYDVKVSEVHGMSQRGGRRCNLCEIWRCCLFPNRRPWHF